MPKSKAETITAASQAELENLLADLRTLLARKELEIVPEVKAFRDRVDEGLQTVRETAVEAAHEAAHRAREAAAEAARRAREAAEAADAYAHDEPWRVAGAALAVGALIGYLIGRR